jgi:hypothetical protein
VPLPVRTASATNITSNSTTLNGFVTNNLSHISKGFQYKQINTPVYTSVTVSTTDSLFSKSISGLASYTEYQFRAYAVVSATDTVFGNLQTFRTTRYWDGSHTAWAQGNGTENNPYLISNAAELAHLAYVVNNGIGAGSGRRVGVNTYWKVVADINLEGDETFQWTPIGYYNSDADYYNFGGHFDGNNHTISNLVIKTSTLQRIGLFGYTDGGSIKNVGIVGNSQIVRNDVVLPAFAGGIVGYANTSIISNCYNTGNISATSDHNYEYYCCSGGIAGQSSSSISNCYNTGNISATASYFYSYSGGIAGQSSSSISNCYNTGNISSYASYYPYLRGIANEGSVTNSYYLVTCGATGAGQSKTEEFMKTAEFVSLLNGGAKANFAFAQDVVPFSNNGYPVLSNSGF